MKSNILESFSLAGKKAIVVGGAGDLGKAMVEGIPKWDALGTTEPKEMVLITQSWKELKQMALDRNIAIKEVVKKLVEGDIRILKT